MRMYIKQKMWSFNEKFYVYDRDNEPQYFVEGKLFSFPKKFSFQDMNGNVLYEIKQVAWSLFPKFKIFKDNELVAVVSRKASFFSPKYEISNLAWSVRGNITGHEYTIYAGNYRLADISRAFFSMGDFYEINIHDEEYAELILVVVIVIDENISITRRSSIP